MLRGVGQRRERGIDGICVTSCTDMLQRGNLLVAHLHVVDLQYRRFVFFIQLVLIHADDNAFTLVDQRLLARGSFFDHPFREPGFDRFRHAACLINLFDDRARLLHDLIGERLDVIRSGQRIDGAADL